MEVFYRILKAPPGYPPEQQYLVAAYETLDYYSCKGGITKDDGSGFSVTLEEARQMIPTGATRLHSQPDHQFLELWEA